MATQSFLTVRAAQKRMQERVAMSDTAEYKFISSGIVGETFVLK